MNFDFMSAEKKKRYKFLLILVFFMVACYLKYFDHRINAQNTTVYAFSYAYGFISRGFLGTFWQWLDSVLPIDLMRFECIYEFSRLGLLFLFLILIAFYNLCLKLCNSKNEKNMTYLCCFLSIFTFPMFLTEQNFGRIDMFLLLLTILSCVLIVKEKFEAFVIPICIICMLMHHGYVFIFFNLVLVLLFYKCLMNDKKRKKYIFILVCTILSVSVLFLYFEFFSHPAGESVFAEVVTNAKSLSQNGDSYNEQLVNHEILGLDVFEDEWKYHIINYRELPMFLFLMFPYVVIGIYFFVQLFKGKSAKEKWAYFAVAAGPITVLPQMILKIDYGRYMFTIIFYYIAMIMCLIAMKDEVVAEQLEKTIQLVKAKVPAAKLLLVYPIALMPFHDVHICLPTAVFHDLIW